MDYQAPNDPSDVLTRSNVPSTPLIHHLGPQPGPTQRTIVYLEPSKKTEIGTTRTLKST